MKKLFYIFTLLGGFAVAQKPARIAFINGTAHNGRGQVIEKCVLLIADKKIQKIGEASQLKVDRSEYDTLIDLRGKHIYPALINPNNVLGLHDAIAVRATRDFGEVGHLNPHIRALIAYNTDNLIVPTVRTNGVLYTQVTPRGGLISGSSSIMGLHGWNWEDAVLKADDGIHLNFPRMVNRKYSEEEDQVIKNANKNYNDEMSVLDRFFGDARAYLDARGEKEKNLRFDAMQSVLNGNANLYIHADKAKDLLAALDFIAKHKIKRAVIVGGLEAYRVSAELRKHSVPVMLNRVNDLPDLADDDVDLVFRLPYLLQKDSVLFCLQMEGDMEAMHSRNLPFNAGVSVTYGLNKEQALSAITWNAAKILGIDQLVGSLETGKLASFVVSDGDILDIRSNNITFAYLEGRPVPLDNQQTQLYNRYRSKYGIK